MALRVAQWTMGGVARAAVRGVVAHPELELVGCYVWSAAKAGQDVGELVGLPPLGITTTNDVDEIVALRPDVVAYMPLVWNVDELVRLLEAGINVVSTANFITGHSYGEPDRLRLDEAAKKGGVSLYGSGINPGLASAVALTAAAACREIERISIFEQSDATSYESAETWRSLGFGSPPDTPGLVETARERQLVFRDVVEVMAETLRVRLDEVRYTAEFGVATKDLHLGYMDIPKGAVCGLNGTWEGIVAGRPLIAVGLLWRLGQAMEPDWEINEGYQIEVRGIPNVRLRYELDYPSNALDKDANTANPAVNAIPAVVAARPGIVTMADLPLVTAGSVRAAVAAG
ncbi:NAD(P)H-dependent amine dehydrogenase family protein [Pseudofrankia inefficax]|uniref:Dihydrodipicolinate reductase n=1 Tax=Pseudofrankia inefficax (strain DSM 45817 / CECT 9037 / DDB 130130 / EuI1c) TaxID=298654 RepID=E3J837_PSEI1|nr:dihydrodipicolinate reductase [Pseudofrankia inefficax]ADP82085.1 dihydrodipicolinate reductase [Pseudofrankia inefficax]